MTVMRSPEWYQERLTYVGASEAAEAVGLSPWGDPIGLWEKKLGMVPERDETDRMKLGRLIEPVIGQLASEALDGRQLRKVSGPIRHPEHPFIGANPDFRVRGTLPDYGRTLVQAKMRLDSSTWGEPDDGVGLGVPLHYRVQAWAELLATGLETCVIAKLDPYNGLTLFPVTRLVAENEQAIEDLRLDLVDFWGYVERREMPPPTADSAKSLLRRFPEAAPVGRVASAEQEVTLEALLVTRDEKKVIERQEDELKNRVKLMIGGAAFMEGAGHRFTWSRPEPKKKTVVEWEPIAKAYRRLLDDMRHVWAKESIEPPDLDAIESLYTREEDVTPDARLTIRKL